MGTSACGGKGSKGRGGTWRSANWRRRLRTQAPPEAGSPLRQTCPCPSAAYATFYLAEAFFHVSGVLALVVCGLYVSVNFSGCITPETQVCPAQRLGKGWGGGLEVCTGGGGGVRAPFLDSPPPSGLKPGAA